MTAIHQALGHLHQIIDSLEDAARNQEQKALEVQQRQQESPDLFSFSAGRIIDPSIIVDHLDKAIEKIEYVLKEG